MPLPPATVARERLHVRSVTYAGFRRSDGMVDIEASLSDVKDATFPLASGARPAGEPIHDIHVRFTINEALEIAAVEAGYDARPYPGACEQIAPQYQALVGLRLNDNFRLHLNGKMGAAKGCTHITEMLAWLPSAAFQTLASTRKEIQPDAATKPFQLDRCHALVSSGETVRRYYPKWYVPAAQNAKLT